MPKWEPENTGYRLDSVTGLPIPSQFDVTKGNPTGDLPKCQRDGNQMIRIGSSSYDLRCPQCGIKPNSRAACADLVKWPADGTKIPRFPPQFVVSERVPENYVQPDYWKPDTDPFVASHHGVPRPPQ